MGGHSKWQRAPRPAAPSSRGAALTPAARKQGVVSHTQTVFTAEFKRNQADVLVTGCFDESIKIWDVTALRCVRTLWPTQGAIYSVAFPTALDDHRMAAVTNKGMLLVFDIGPKGKGKVCARRPAHPTAAHSRARRAARRSCGSRRCTTRWCSAWTGCRARTLSPPRRTTAPPRSPTRTQARPRRARTPRPLLLAACSARCSVTARGN